MKIHKILLLIVALLFGILLVYGIDNTLLNTEANNMFSVYEIY